MERDQQTASDALADLDLCAQMLDVKVATLANALIRTMRTSIDD